MPKIRILRSLRWFGAGLVATPFLEYAWHAWIGHGKADHYSGADHRDHHKTASLPKDPWEEIGENISEVGRSVLALSGALSPIVGQSRALPLAVGLAAGYVGTTLYHARMHIRGPKTRYEKWMWRFHWYHHAHDARVNFGLTNPIFDVLFGTAVVPDEVFIPEPIRPAWMNEEAHGFRFKKARTDAVAA